MADFTRTALALLGLILVPVGIAGLLLPVLPGTPLLIAAAACFARSSPQFENHLVNHPRFGASIRAWRERGAIPLRAKLIALAAMTASALLIAGGGAPVFAKVIAFSGMAAAALFIVTRPGE